MNFFIPCLERRGCLEFLLKRILLSEVSLCFAEMPSKIRDIFSKQGSKIAFFLLLLTIVFVLTYSGKWPTGQATAESGGEGQENPDGSRMLLGIGGLLFWLACLSVTLVSALKLAEFLGKY